MRTCVFRHLLRMAVAIVFGVLLLVPPVMAQNNQAVDQFLANPNQTLQQYPNGGAKLISLIRDAALANPSALSTIIALLANANSDQQAAIGSSLGQAARTVVRTDQAYANQIQQALAESEIQNAITAFAAVTGNVSIGLTDAGGSGGGGGGGGQVGSGGLVFGGSNYGSAQSLGGLHYPTTSQNYLTGGGVSSTTNATSAGTSSGSVSPH